MSPKRVKFRLNLILGNMKNGNLATGQIKLVIKGKPLEVQVSVPVKPVKPQRMLPVLQKMTNLFVNIGVEATQSAGGEISCKKGCGACCRQPVPLPEFEAYNIAEIVEKMPEPRRSQIKARFEEALTHLTEIGWIERFEDCADYSESERTELFLDYFKEKIPCPFLVDDSCSIHQERPLACREYLVTNPAEHCSNPTANSINLIEIPVAPSKRLLKFGQKKPLRGLNVIPLIMSLKWVRTNQDNFQKKTGEKWMADFLQQITENGMPNKSVTDSAGK